MSADQEERLLLQLREITRVMQEGRLVEGVAPAEMGAQHWEGRLGLNLFLSLFLYHPTPVGILLNNMSFVLL